jgi:hypothetical protein
LFTPEWQRQFPDALTVFGWRRFARWFVRHYGANPQWVDFDAAPDQYEPALQLRIAYGGQAAWQEKFPNALFDAVKARALLEWLASGEAGLSGPALQWCRGLDAQATASEILKSGVNVIGHFCYPSGLRISAESMVKGMDLAGLSTSLRDLWTDVKDDPHHVDFRGHGVQ